MKILVACEYSGRVRDAFRALGHDAVSCDLLPTESDGPHYHGDVFDIINDGWDMLVAFPPCTHICVSGAHAFKQKIADGRQQQGIDFFMAMVHVPIDRICVENPVGIMSTRHRKPDQIIQPHWFGDDASKKTCLWLKNLPLLVPTNMLVKDIYGNQTPSGQNNVGGNGGPNCIRSKIRSLTYQGIANAMATQWNVLTDPVSDVEQIELFS
jgi:hypothetical protein